jgi:signal transduction histidine kinase
VTVDPGDVKTNTLTPPVVIEEMKVDGQPVGGDLTSAPLLKIPPGRHRFEFRFAGLSFAAPEKVRFKCQLKGMEPGWVDNGTQRVAPYNYIPPGDYVFHVAACNNDEIWNDQGASLAFTVLPYFWQTLSFRILGGVLMVMAGGGVVWLDARRRTRFKLERLERQRAIERERARISKDIHDDLGASLTRITLLSQSARGDLENPEQAALDLDRIYSTARELTRAMDEIVWAVNPKHDTLDSLASYLGRFAQEFLGTANLSCRLDVPVQLPAWPMTSEVRHNLFLAVKEALNNVVKHASAREVRVLLALQADAFTLSLEDDGCGFDPSRPVVAAVDRLSSGNGLGNMRRRLAEIRGRFQVESASGKGTRVVFVVPVNIRLAEQG